MNRLICEPCPLLLVFKPSTRVSALYQPFFTTPLVLVSAGHMTLCTLGLQELIIKSALCLPSWVLSPVEVISNEAEGFQVGAISLLMGKELGDQRSARHGASPNPYQSLAFPARSPPVDRGLIVFVDNVFPGENLQIQSIVSSFYKIGASRIVKLWRKRPCGWLSVERPSSRCRVKMSTLAQVQTVGKCAWDLCAASGLRTTFELRQRFCDWPLWFNQQIGAERR